MSKSATAIKAQPYKAEIKYQKVVKAKFESAANTYQSQLKADPQMALRKQMQLAGMARRIAEAKAAL